MSKIQNDALVASIDTRSYTSKVIEGFIYVLGDDITTDHILPGIHVRINPSTSEGYKELGGYAFSGLADDAIPFLDNNSNHYNIVVAGYNFGSGSSREHAVVALGSAGVKIIVAKSFARILFRNCITTGEVLPVVANVDLSRLQTGMRARIDLDGETFELLEHNYACAIDPISGLADIVEAGGMFAYARKIGKIKNNIIHHR